MASLGGSELSPPLKTSACHGGTEREKAIFSDKEVLTKRDRVKLR